MKRFRFVLSLILVLTVALGSPLTAFAASWDVTDSAGVSNAFVTDTDAEVIINMQNDIDMDHYLEANEGQNYVINGNGNTISDVMLGGSGTVDINADVSAEENGVALNASGEVDITVDGDVTSYGTGVVTNEESSVIVNGDVTAGGAGVISDGESSAVVNGDITAEGSGIITDGESTVAVEGNVDAGAAGIFAREDSTVTVEGDIASDGSGIITSDDASVTVEGDITSSEGFGIDNMGGEVDVSGDVSGEYGGVWAGEDSTVTVEGDVTANSGNGIDAWGGEVNVTGDVSGEYGGVLAGEDSTVTVEGDVTANSGNGIDAWGGEVNVTGDVSGENGGISANEDSTVTVTGNVTVGTNEWGYGGTGVFAMEDSTVTVDGNVTGGDATLTEEELQDPTAGGYGGDGVYASEEANVTVTGDVTGGDGAGTCGDGGEGINAQGEATVTVGGDVTGGDVVADPEVEAEAEEYIIDSEGNTETYYPYVSYGGSGVAAEYSATVTVGGDVTGGSTNGDKGHGGNGIQLSNYTYSMSDEVLEAGSVTVEGTVSGGNGGADGEGGTALYWSADMGYLPVEEMDLEKVVETPYEELTESQIDMLVFALNYALSYGELDYDVLMKYEEEAMAQITENMTDEEIYDVYYAAYQKILANEISDYAAIEDSVIPFGEVTVGTLSDKNGPALGSSGGVEAAERYAKLTVTETAPSIGSNPRTGDDSNVMFFVVLMSVSMLGIGVLFSQRKRFV